MAVTVGAKALGKLGRELAGLSPSATCDPGKKRGEYFFNVVDGPGNIGIIPLSRIEDAILKRLQDGATSFRATVTKLEWKEVQYSVQLVIQLTPVSKN